MRWEHARLVFYAAHTLLSFSSLHSLECCYKRIPIVVHISFSLRVILYSRHSRTAQSRGLSIFGLFFLTLHTRSTYWMSFASYSIESSHLLCTVLFFRFLFFRDSHKRKKKKRKRNRATHLLMFRLYQPENVVYYYFFGSFCIAVALCFMRMYLLLANENWANFQLTFRIIAFV